MRIGPESSVAARGGAITAWLAALVLAAVVALTWFGYRAASEWQAKAAQLLVRRQQDVALSLTINLVRHMRAVQLTVLDRHEWGAEDLRSPQQLAAVIAPAFQRYSYPEVFFASSLPLDPNFVARQSRMPAWAGDGGEAAGVRWFKNREVAQLLWSRLEADARSGRLYSIFSTNLRGTEYQVVVRFLRGATSADVPLAVVGFLVNMQWARSNYFVPMLESVMNGTGVTVENQVVDPTGIDFALVDQNAVPTGGRAAIQTRRNPTRRRFSAYFFDPVLTSTESVHDVEKWAWSLEVTADEDPTLTIALRGARRTMLVLAAGAIVLGIGLTIIVRATRAAAAVASMRSEFVSTVTHELKTPMAVIQSIGQTMVRGRVTSPEQQHEYAQLLVQETYRLRHLIDNLLAYARVTQVADVYAFEALQPDEVVQEALVGFRKLLRERGIEVKVSVRAPLPPIRGDRTSIVFALDNLIDNAMRHAGASHIELEARLNGEAVEFVVSDYGRGIPDDEMKRVQQPFVRGGATGRGSGLGLAIVRRIAAAHRGRFELESRVNVGTAAILAIPVAA